MLHKNQVQTLPKRAKRAPTAKQRKSCPAPQRPAAKRSSKTKPSTAARLIKLAVIVVLAYALVPMSWLHAIARGVQ